MRPTHVAYTVRRNKQCAINLTSTIYRFRHLFPSRERVHFTVFFLVYNITVKFDRLKKNKNKTYFHHLSPVVLPVKQFTMSDVEEAVEVGEHGDMYNLLKEVLKNAQVNGSLLHGIHEGAKALEKKLGKNFTLVVAAISCRAIYLIYFFLVSAQECCACWPTTARKPCTRNW